MRLASLKHGVEGSDGACTAGPRNYHTFLDPDARKCRIALDEIYLLAHCRAYGRNFLHTVDALSAMLGSYPPLATTHC